MPRVPQYDDLQARATAGPQLRPVDNRAAPNAHFQSDTAPGSLASTAAIGKGLGDAAHVAGQIVASVQDRENLDRVLQADTLLKDEYLKHEAGIRERKGQAAWGATKDTEQFFADAQKRHGEGLTNSVQQREFGNQLAKLRQQAIHSASTYEAGERRSSLEQTSRASIVTAINLAAANHNNPEVVGTAKTDILKRVELTAQMNGWAPEVRDAAAGEYLTNFHKQILQNKIEENPTQAKAYYEANKGEINGASRGEIEKTLKIGTLKVVSQTFADQVMAANLTEADAVKKARDSLEGDEEAAAVTEIKLRFGETAQARERAQRTAADEAWGIYGRSQRMASIPASVQARMDGRDLAAIRNDEQSRVERNERRAAVKEARVPTDWDRYYELRTMAIADPAAFRAVDMRREFAHLAPAARESLIDLQTRIKQPDDVKDAATLSQQLSNSHDLMKWGNKDKDKKGAFDIAATAEIQSEEKRIGKKLDYDARQKVIDRLLVNGEVTGGGFFGLVDPDRQFFQVRGTNDEAKFVPTVPKTERTKIEEAFQRQHQRKPTDAEVIDAYKRKVKL